MSFKLPARQVHLDFHTSEHIPGIGAAFDKAEWQAALRAGHVNSITVFAKCHHSWSYYFTKVGRPHPALTRNLLGEQIAACHEIGVRAPIYYTVGWSATDAETHPDWCARNKDGSLAVSGFDVKAKPTDPKPAFNWKFLCPSGGYLAHMVEQTQEICAQFPVDGFFYDICHWAPCYCDTCRAGMQAEGLNADVEADAAKYNVLKWQRCMTACNAAITAKHPDATLFYNGGGGNHYAPEWHAWQTHHELEDLPTTWGGYDKFPIRAKYFATRGKAYLAMSGKFHTAWGEFGGFKHPDAIRFEAACMIAFGARCSFGDQLHPNGRMDPATYANIGAGYAYVEQIEEYGLDGRPCANLGLWLCGNNADDQGVASMLMEAHLDFEIVDPAQPLDRYAAVIIPGGPCLDEAAAAKLNAYAQAGGKLLVLGAGALDKARTRFLLDVGADYKGPAAFAVDYLVAGRELAKDLVTTPFLNYAAALRVEPKKGAKVLAAVCEPYFDRTYEHYCSHQNTPNKPEPAAHPGAWKTGRIVCLAHALGDLYHYNGARVHRQFFLNALALIYRNPVLKVERLPSAGRVNLVHQPAAHRYVAHLMYSPPLVRGRCQVIEDLPELTRVRVTLRVPEAVQNAYLVPGQIPLRLAKQHSGTVKVTVPRFSCHAAVVFEY